MDIRIGIVQSVKEVTVELPLDADRDAVKAHLAAALAKENAVLWLTDRLGREVGIPTDRIAYLELGATDAERRFGFAGA